MLLHVDYLLDRLNECEEILHSQIFQLHDVLRVVTNGRITPSVVSPNEIKSVMNEIAQKYLLIYNWALKVILTSGMFTNIQ